MTNTYKTLGQLQLPITTAAEIYTVPSGQSAIVKFIGFVNKGLSATIELWAGTSAVDLTSILPAVTLGAGEFGNGSGTLTLAAGESIWGRSSLATTISVTLSGDEIS